MESFSQARPKMPCTVSNYYGNRKMAPCKQNRASEQVQLKLFTDFSLLALGPSLSTEAATPV